VLYYSSAEGTRAGNLLLCTVKQRSLSIHVYFAHRQREMATGKKKVAGGREERRAFPPPPVLLR